MVSLVSGKGTEQRAQAARTRWDVLEVGASTPVDTVGQQAIRQQQQAGALSTLRPMRRRLPRVLEMVDMLTACQWASGSRRSWSTTDVWLSELRDAPDDAELRRAGRQWQEGGRVGRPAANQKALERQRYVPPSAAAPCLEIRVCAVFSSVFAPCVDNGPHPPTAESTRPCSPGARCEDAAWCPCGRLFPSRPTWASPTSLALAAMQQRAPRRPRPPR